MLGWDGSEPKQGGGGGGRPERWLVRGGRVSGKVREGKGIVFGIGV
jgi:hypothetical protein